MDALGINLATLLTQVVSFFGFVFYSFESSLRPIGKNY
ncbi:MAG: hypothetical protein CM1200mP7_0310 [Chloroflexota bacterium]|nr:MAG: hypothetical protein CM1200mP7_0310 [Chloroflexota bacterium]